MMVPTDKLEPGMQVASDIMNVNNMLLMAKGSVLAPRSIRLLKTWGIDAVNVVGGEEPEVLPKEPIRITPETLQLAEAMVQTRFQHVNSNEGIPKLVRALAVKRIARRLYQQANSPKK
jgi:hypothetical protein